MRLLLTLTFGLIIGGLSAQTTLPTAWDFATTPSNPPTGWSTNTTASYSSGLPDNSGGTSRAGKLQATAHHFTIHFFDEPGTVTYNLRAYSSNGANFTGTFKVQESEGGSTWSDLDTYTDDDFGNSWTEFTSNPDVDARYIRFFFTDKISGINVGLDDVTIEESIPTEQEINLTYLGADAPSGTEIQFASGIGNPLVVKLGVENIGTVNTLTLDAASISGAASGDYTVSSLPASVPPSSSDTIEITFTPTASGTRLGELSIDNNDGNEDPYLITLSGIGGTNASEPTTAPGQLQVDILKTYRVKASFDAGDAESSLVLFKKNAPINFTPQDGSEYEKGQGVGNAKVANVGDLDAFWLKEATADDTFYVSVYGYNGSGAFTNYLESDPLDTTIVTPKRSSEFLDYYGNLDVKQSDFIEDLRDIIFPHTVRFYSNYAPDMIRPFTERDTTNEQAVVTGVYSGDNVVYSPPFGWQETGMNREHTLPYSWMPSNGSTSTPEYQDFHHLFPTVATANSQRSNEPFGEVVNVTSSYGMGKRGTDASGNTVYEPRNAQKGDAARAMLYMMTTYDDPTGDRWGFDHLLTNGSDQRFDVLLDWHIADPPSGFEMARNDYLDSLQENRNPFVDSMHFVCYIDFKTMEYISSPDSACLLATMPQPASDDTDSLIGIGALPMQTQFTFYPNPVNDQLYVSSDDQKVFDFVVLDLAGRVVLRQHAFESGWITTSALTPGIYMMRLSSGGQDQVFRLVKQ